MISSDMENAGQILIDEQIKLLKLTELWGSIWNTFQQW